MTVQDIVAGRFAPSAKPEAVLESLSLFRAAVSKTFVDGLKQAQRQNVWNFIFRTIHEIWNGGVDEMKTTASSTAGYALIRLAPFYSEAMLKSLIEEILRIRRPSTFLASLFVYLSRFFAEAELCELFVTENLPLIFGVPTEHEVRIFTCNAKALPHVYLVALAKHYIQIRSESRDLCLKAARKICRVSSSVYMEVIKEDTPLDILGAVFANHVPTLPAQLVKTLTSRCVEAIGSRTTDRDSFDGACDFLRALILSQQAEPECVHGLYDRRTLSDAVSVASVLSLPIEEDVVLSTFGTGPWGGSMARCHNEELDFSLDASYIGRELMADDREESNELMHVRPFQESNSPAVSVRSVKDSSSKDSPVDVAQSFTTSGPARSTSMMLTDSSEDKMIKPRFQSGNRKARVASVVTTMACSNSPVEQPKRSMSRRLSDFAGVISSRSSIDCGVIDRSLLVPLMKYFSCFKNHDDELGDLVMYSHRVSSELFCASLKVMAIVAGTMDVHTFNSILHQVFAKENPTEKEYEAILNLVKHLSLDRMLKVVVQSMTSCIESVFHGGSYSLRKRLMQAMAGLRKLSSRDGFMMVVDDFVLKLDVMDHAVFEGKLRLVADMLSCMKAGAVKAFSRIHVLLMESVSLFYFPKRIITNILRIEAAFADGMLSVSEFETSIEIAVGILDTSCRGFMGVGLAGKATGIFSLKPRQIEWCNMVDSDLITNPRTSHAKLIKTAKAAYRLLCLIPWERANLKKSELSFLTALATQFVVIFPAQSNVLFETLVKCNVIDNRKYNQYVQTTMKISTAQRHVISLVRMLTVPFEGKEDIDISRMRGQLTSQGHFYRNMSWDEVCVLRKFCEKEGITEGNEQLQLVDRSEMLYRRSPSTDLIQLEEDSEGDEAENEYAGVNTGTDAGVDSGFSRYLMSITPLVFGNMDVSEKLLTAPMINSFAQYSHALINPRQCRDLFTFALDRQYTRALAFIVRMADRLSVGLRMEQHLDHPMFRKVAVFSVAFGPLTRGRRGWRDLSPAVLSYIQAFTSHDLFKYMLNAKRAQRAVGRRFVQFDGGFFIRQCRATPAFTLPQLENLCFYASSFPQANSDVRDLLAKLLILTKGEKEKHFLVHRIVAVYMLRERAPGKEMAALIAKVVKESLTGDNVDVSGMKPAHLVALYTSAVVLKKRPEIEELAAILSPILRLSNPYGAYLLTLRADTTDSEICELLSSPLASVITRAVACFNSKMKAKSAYVPPSACLSFVQKMTWTATTRDVMHMFTHFAVVKPLNLYAVKELFRKCCTTVLSGPVHSEKTLSLLSRSMPFLLRNREEMRFAMKLAAEIVEHQPMAPGAVEVFVKLCRKGSSGSIIGPVLSRLLHRSGGMLAVTTAELLALDSLMTSEDHCDATRFVPNAISFYAMFNAVVVLEKKNRQMGHARMAHMFRGRYRVALDFLKDRKMRLFAPWLALAPSDAEIPRWMREFFSSAANNVQRLHEVDSSHEF